MNRARKLPDGFTESMILHRPSQNIMNELASSVLALYSYDRRPGRHRANGKSAGAVASA